MTDQNALSAAVDLIALPEWWSDEDTATVKVALQQYLLSRETSATTTQTVPLIALEQAMDALAADPDLGLTDEEKEELRNACQVEIRNALANERMKRMTVEPEETLKLLQELEARAEEDGRSSRFTNYVIFHGQPPHVVALAMLVDRARDLERLPGKGFTAGTVPGEKARELRATIAALASRWDAVERGR